MIESEKYIRIYNHNDIIRGTSIICYLYLEKNEIPSYNSTELLGCFTKYTRIIAKSSLNDYLLSFNSQYDTQPMILLTTLRAGFIVNKHLKR